MLWHWGKMPVCLNRSPDCYGNRITDWFFDRLVMHGKLKTATLVIAAIVAFISVQIEVLNVRAGGPLPNREYYGGDPRRGVVKWRLSPWTNERSWRTAFGPRDEQGKPSDRPLTADEQARMDRDITHALAHNRLRSFVSSAGLLQYVLVPLLAVLSITMMLRKPRSVGQVVTGAVPLFVAIGAGILMFSRAYFTSLGW